MSAEPRHFVDIVRRHAALRGDQLAYRFLRQEVESETVTFAQLDRAARAIARAFDGRVGQHALLLFPPGLDFVKAFIGCWYAGVVPVPCAPPTREPELQRVLRIAKSANVTMVLSVGGLVDLIRNELVKAAMGNVEVMATETWLDAGDHAWSDPGIRPETTALLQYTSGSTSDPKGVVVSHGNLFHNERMITELFEHNEQTSVVGWLPLHHDMGLIGNVLQPLWLGREVTLMSPVDFMMRPLSWLRAISKYRATTSGGPNFAYELCVDAASPEDIASLDLSTWTLAYNGAEPIRMFTLEAFSRTFGPCGFRRETFYPCYGLAEATLIVTGVRKADEPRAKTYDRAALAQNRATASSANDESSIALVSCGASACGTRFRIVDPETRRALPDGEVGEIWVTGEAVAQGYYGQPELSAEVFAAKIVDELEDRWLRTGDLGFLEQGELVIAGRLKDLLIVRGRNHHPQDIEQTVWESHEVLREGRAAAFTVDTEGDERLIVVQEVVRDLTKDRFDESAIAGTVRTNVARVHGLSLGTLVLVRPGQVPKTSSGKIRRQACRTLYIDNALKLFSTPDA